MCDLGIGILSLHFFERTVAQENIGSSSKTTTMTMQSNNLSFHHHLLARFHSYST